MAPDCGLAEFLVGHLVGKVGAHQHVHGHLEVTRDDVRDEFDAAALGLVEALDERETDSGWLGAAVNGARQVLDELVRHDEDEDVGTVGGFADVRNCDLWKRRGNLDAFC